jgi:alpha-tubulin suppressor-like RCC1 family protein
MFARGDNSFRQIALDDVSWIAEWTPVGWERVLCVTWSSVYGLCNTRLCVQGFNPFTHTPSPAPTAVPVQDSIRQMAVSSDGQWLLVLTQGRMLCVDTQTHTTTTCPLEHIEAISMETLDKTCYALASHTLYRWNPSDDTVTPALEGVQGIASGEQHTLAVTLNGHVYGWGMNRYGQLGRGCVDMTCHTPERVPVLEDVVQVACGPWHSAARTSTGDVYTFGWDQDNALGTDPIDKNTSLPEPIALLNTAVSVVCGVHSTLVVDEHHQLWKSGSTWARIHPSVESVYCHTALIVHSKS